MSKKSFIIIAAVLVLIFLGLAGYYFMLQSNTPGSTNTTANIFKNFFPFGGNSASPGTTGTSTTTGGTSGSITAGQSNYQQKLRKIWADPVAGFGLIGDGVGTIVRHMDAATSHIYETDLFSPRQDEISDTTIPTAYNAYWGTDSDSVISQYLDTDNQTVNTFLLSVKPIMATTTTGISIATNNYKTTATALPGHIESLSISSSTLFYLTQNQFNSVGYTSNVTGGSQKQVWNSPITEILSQFVNSSTVALTTKPYQNISGYLYFVNTTTGGVMKILGDIPGLSTLVSPDAKKVLVLSQGGGTNNMYVYTIADGSVVPLANTTFPEKCVWSKKNTSIIYCAIPRETLDDTSLTSWYMGTAQFTDDIWKIDLTANTAHSIENLVNDSKEVIDVTKIALSGNEQYLVFINKRDGALWSLDLTK